MRIQITKNPVITEPHAKPLQKSESLTRESISFPLLFLLHLFHGVSYCGVAYSNPGTGNTHLCSLVDGIFGSEVWEVYPSFGIPRNHICQMEESRFIEVYLPGLVFESPSYIESLLNFPEGDFVRGDVL